MEGKEYETKGKAILLFAIVTLAFVLIFGGLVYILYRSTTSSKDIYVYSDEEEDEDGDRVRVHLPASFYKEEGEIDGISIDMWTNGRYDIFYATFDCKEYEVYDGKWYIREKYDDAVIPYNQDFMSGSGAMVNINARGTFVEGQVEFLPIYSEDRPPGLDDVYEQCLVRALGVETYCWIIGSKNMKYVVIRGVYKEHEDWYVYYRGNEENKAIRYEPSFMGGE